MKILLESDASQTFSFIPREYPALINYTLTDEMLNTSASDTNVTATQTGAYLRISKVFVLKEERFYNISIFKTDDTLIYRGRIFCTNQTISTYSTVDGVYTEDDTKDNEYVVVP